MSDNPIHAESIHLYNLSHLAPLNPVNSYYNNEFLKHSLDNSLNQSPLVLGKFCSKCSSLLIPGLTVHIKILYRKKDKKTSKVIKVKLKNDVPGRRLQYKCLNCRFKSIDETLVQESRKVQERIVLDAPKTKRKKNTLSSMLEKKKKLKDGKSGFGSMNLMEFML